MEDFKDFMKGSQVIDTALFYRGVRKVFNRKFLHKRNIDFERYSFNLVSQERDESMGEFISRLKHLARYYTFDMFATEDALRLQIIEGCQFESLYRHLGKKHYLLGEIEEMIRISDHAGEHEKKIEAGKLAKWEQAVRLQTRQKEQQSPECRRTLKSTTILDKQVAITAQINRAEGGSHS
ncbi:hypothetical protein NDU88_005353 [Pleurodeles waltl]|uniref:Retrotransposon gag domain-containing protein n=1 Tax=Pleurodeles waltl TaxID=8319 RepID=A0AAV7WZA0_PLEWA|nr:hypothetical protein NDU88_005353 [Pleurodeles waltl]